MEKVRSLRGVYMEHVCMCSNRKRGREREGEEEERGNEGVKGDCSSAAVMNAPWADGQTVFVLKARTLYVRDNRGV